MKLAAFDQGQTPTVALVDNATVSLGVDLKKLAAVLQKFVSRDFFPVWGTPCKVIVAKKVPAGAWGIVFLDRPDIAGALGYHDVTTEGLPLSKIFVRTTLAAGEKVSVTASHELAEMLVDPAVQMLAEGPNGWLYAYETADAVQSDEYKIDGIAVTNWVYPSWFEAFHRARSRKFDHMGLCTKPFEVRPGGYMPVLKNGRWDQIFAARDVATKNRFKIGEHPRTHRRATGAHRRSQSTTKGKA